jgi:UDP-N-acetylmuramate--alanine ligase
MEINFSENSKLTDFKSVYFIGIGGIGMSALARYFKALNYSVGGYDKTPSPLTDQLMHEGCSVHFEDRVENLPLEFQNVLSTLIIITPAIPQNHGELNHVRQAGYTILKRSEVLGLITQSMKGLCVAGTHGKTTTSTLLAHILHSSKWECSAFLGGISTNFNSNLLISSKSEYAVIEADEFDRSFLRLSPYGAIITSADPDHLDIYGTAEKFQEGFQLYANRINPLGFLVLKEGLPFTSLAKTITYAVGSETADFRATNLRVSGESFLMDVIFKDTRWNDIELGVPGIHNAENALGCIALLVQLGMSESDIRMGLKTFRGVKRRFEYIIREKNLIYIDDYAHHPKEIEALIDSVRLMYPTKKITGIFQPHLFSRTADFMDSFAEELSRLDEILVMPIYPARELPIAGITSDVLVEKINNPQKKLVDAKNIGKEIAKSNLEVLLTIGAGDIDRIVNLLKEQLNNEQQL